MKKLLFVLLLLSIISDKNVFAQESAEGEVTPDLKTEEYTSEEAYVFPVIKPDILLYGGYRYVNADISDRAEEFEYLHDSITLG